MEFHISYLSVFVILTWKIDNIVCKIIDYSAVTTFDGLENLYARMRSLEPHEKPDVSLDYPNKKKVCYSITKSDYFDMIEEDPVDLEDVYEGIVSRSSEETKKKNKNEPSNTFYTKLMNANYHKTAFWGMNFISFRPQPELIEISPLNQEDYAFPCATKNRSSDGSLNLYFITDPYDINKALEVPTDSRINARFICKTTENSVCDLKAMAEEPAQVFDIDFYPLENIYLQMRKYYNAAGTQTEQDSPICRLTSSDKLRACASAMGSPLFKDDVKFQPDIKNIPDKCMSYEITFRSDEAKKEGEGNRYYEFVLPCSVKFKDSNAPYTFYVARAYQSHYAMVLIPGSEESGIEKLHIETISANISVIIEKHVVNKNEEIPPPNLVDLLIEKPVENVERKNEEEVGKTV